MYMSWKIWASGLNIIFLNYKDENISVRVILWVGTKGNDSALKQNGDSLRRDLPLSICKLISRTIKKQKHKTENKNTLASWHSSQQTEGSRQSCWSQYVPCFPKSFWRIEAWCTRVIICSFFFLISQKISTIFRK